MEVAFEVVPPPPDRDGDGYVGSEDCDETRRDVNVGAVEKAAANGIDDDCDGVVDEGTAAFDDDGDGYSEDGGDCDDDDTRRFPGAAELPDCRDQDCDGEVDEGVERRREDDADEPDDQLLQAVDLGTDGLRSFERSLVQVTRGVEDEEWVTFYSQDGDFDLWGIVATFAELPEGSAYDLEIVDAMGKVVASRRVEEEGQAVETAGRAFRDDSGRYGLRIRPRRVREPWCPLRVVLVSR